MPLQNTRTRSRSVGRRNRFNKTQRRSRSSEPYKNINAEKIGEGAYGIVSRPPARCAHFFSNNSKNINERNINSIVFQETYYKNPDYISKLMEMNEAQTELEIGKVIKNNIKMWSDYFCFIEFICGAPSDKHIRTGINDYQDTYGIARYCGVTLENILTNKYYISPKEACRLLDSLKELILGVAHLHNIQVYHQDIHQGNVLFNPKDGRMRLIDFGLAIDLSEETGTAKTHLDDTENLIFLIIIPTLKYIEDTLKTAKEKTNAMRKCLEEVTSLLRIAPLRTKRRNLNANYYRFLARLRDEFVDYISLVLGKGNSSNRLNNNRINK